MRHPLLVWTTLIVAAVARGAEPAAVPAIDSPDAARTAQQAAAQQLAQPVQFTNSVGMKFQLIPAAEFVMGADAEPDAPRHAVRITKPFYIGTHELTRQQWETVTGKKWSDVFPGPDQPMNYLSWYEAHDFFAALKKKEGKTYRLPTEAEWELAARAGSSSRYLIGDSEADLDKVAWYDRNSGAGSHPVGQKQSNAFGLYDVLGNLWEWCEDFYDKDSYRAFAADDPTGPALTLARYRVLRGGSVLYGPQFCSVFHRDYYQESRSAKHIGVRVVLPVDQPKGK